MRRRLESESGFKPVPALIRSRYNQRKHQSVLRSYVKGVLEKGVQIAMRGTIIVQETDDDNTNEVLAGATLCEAVTVGADVAPTNPFLLQAVMDGLEACIIVKKATPRDICSLIRYNHTGNEFHSGAGTSFIEIAEKAIDAGNKWRGHCRVNGMSVDSMPKTGGGRYEAVMRNFISQKYGPLFANFPHYQNVSAFVTKAKQLGIFDTWKQLAEDKVDFLSIAVDAQAIADIQSHSLTVMLSYTGRMEPEIQTCSPWAC